MNLFLFLFLAQIDGQEITAAAVLAPRPTRVIPRRSPIRRLPPRWRPSPPRFRDRRRFVFSSFYSIHHIFVSPLGIFT